MKTNVKFLIVIIVLLSISSTVISQTYNLKAHNVTVADAITSRSADVRIDIKMITHESRIIIYSNDTQVIDYDIIRTYVDDDNYRVMECSATDSDYKNIGLELLFSNTENHAIIVVEYSNIAYAYSCTLIK